MARTNNRYPNSDVTDWVLVNNKRQRLNKEGKISTTPKHQVVSNEVGKVLDVVRRLRAKGIFATAVRA